MEEKQLLKLIKQTDLKDYKSIFELYFIFIKSGYKVTVELEDILKKTSKKQLREDDYFEFYNEYINRITRDDPNWSEKYFEKKAFSKSLQNQVMEEKNNPKYPALNVISGFLKYSAYFTLFFGIGLVVYLVTEGNPQTRDEIFASIILPLVVTVISFTIVLAFSELIKVFLDIEFNTRNKFSDQ